MPDGLKLYGLLHDGHEAFTGDLIRPLKIMLRPHVQRIEDAIDAVIWEKAELVPPTPALNAIIKAADLRMLATEKRDIMPNSSEPWPVIEGLTPDPRSIAGLPWHGAYSLWLQKFEEWSYQITAMPEAGT